MKKIISVLLAALLAVTAFPITVFADEGSSLAATSGVTGGCIWTLSDDGVLTVNGDGAMDNYDGDAPWGTDVREAVFADGVTAIGNGALEDCAALTAVTLPVSVTAIGEKAFYGCSALNNVMLSESVQTIGASAFYGCESLTEITVPGGVTAVAEYTFAYCENLAAVSLPDGVTAIDSGAFAGCVNLQAVALPSQLTTLGRAAFSGCEGLGAVAIPDGVTYIGISAFSDCSGLTEVTLPDSVSVIGSESFARCTSLTAITFPDSLTEIGGSAFRGCTGLTALAVPSGVVSIGQQTFYGCTGLQQITIGTGIQRINRGAFFGCIGLRETNIAQTDTLTIDEKAFADCPMLETMRIAAASLGTARSMDTMFENDEQLTVYGPHANALLKEAARAASRPYIGTDAHRYSEGSACSWEWTANGSAAVCHVCCDICDAVTELRDKAPYIDARGEYPVFTATVKAGNVSFTNQMTGSEPTQTTKVPKIIVTTEKGNGTSLTKEIGYVNAHLVIVDDNETIIDNDVSFKVRGNSTAKAPKKPFTFKFNKKNALFDMGSGKKWVLLANTFDPTLLRNYLAFDLAEELGLAYTSKQKIVELWLDGSFRGCYTLMEPVQEGKDRVNINIDDNNDFMIEYEKSRLEDDVTYFTTSEGLRFAISEPDEPTEEQAAYIAATVEELTEVINSGDRAVMEQRLDIPSFVKFYLLNEYCKTHDFNFSSVFFYYKDGKFYAGPPWDYDLALGNINEKRNEYAAFARRTDQLLIADMLFYRSLCRNDWFMTEVKREYARHLDYFRGIYADGGWIDTMYQEYADVFARNYREAGWTMTAFNSVMRPPRATYELNLAYFKLWCHNRGVWLETYFDAENLRYIAGDCNGDGRVNVKDVTALQRYLAELGDAFPEDIALRGSVRGEALSVEDVTAIQQYIAEYETSYPIGVINVK